MQWMVSNIVATEILDPQAGDVTFKIRDEDKGVVCLSAQKTILAANSDYFEARKHVLEPSLTLTGFAIEWDQFGRDLKDDQQNPDSPQRKRKRPGPGTLSQIENVDEEVFPEDRSEPMARGFRGLARTPIACRFSSRDTLRRKGNYLCRRCRLCHYAQYSLLPLYWMRQSTFFWP